MAGNGSGIPKSKIPTAFLLLFAVLFLAGKAAGGRMETVLAQGEPFPGEPQGRTADIVAKDLNFDGWDDLCIRKPYDGRGNVPYSCMLWNPQKERFEYSVTLYNVETDPEKQWISSRIRESDGRESVTFYRYDAENRLHMVRYLEENPSETEIFERLDLTYVEEGSIYVLPAIEGEENLNETMIAMAKQALTELYEWTGEKIDTACFQVSNMGGVVFALSPEDMEHSRIFCSRSFGADTEYNLSDYDKSISSLGVVSGRSAWYSPVSWRNLPENIDAMTDEDVVIWYFEHMPTAYREKVKTTYQRYEDMWTTQTRSGKWYEVMYNPALREVTEVTGPYSGIPMH